jgi:hypothetical protein
VPHGVVHDIDVAVLQPRSTGLVSMIAAGQICLIDLAVSINGCFYEGVCQVTLNSDVQWFSGLSAPCAVVVMSYP